MGSQEGRDISEPKTAREWLEDEYGNNARYRFRTREKGALWDAITRSATDPEHSATVVRVTSRDGFQYQSVPLDQPIIAEAIPTWREARARRLRALTAEEPIGTVPPDEDAAQ